MENIKHNTYDCIRLENQICFPLYSCAKEVVRQYRKPLESLNLTYTQYLVMMVLREFGVPRPVFRCRSGSSTARAASRCCIRAGRMKRT